MAIPDRESIRRRLDSLGIVEVKRRLEVGAYAANKIPVVMAWLEEQQQLPPIEAAPEKSKTLADQYIERLKNHPVIAVIVVITVTLVGAAQLTDSIAKIASNFYKTDKTKQQLFSFAKVSATLNSKSTKTTTQENNS